MAAMSDCGIASTSFFLVQPHPRRHRNGRIGKYANGDCGKCAHDTGNGDEGVFVHTGLAEYIGIDEDDIGHRQKRRQPGHNLRFQGSSSFAQIEIFCKHFTAFSKNTSRSKLADLPSTCKDFSYRFDIADLPSTCEDFSYCFNIAGQLAQNHGPQSSMVWPRPIQKQKGREVRLDRDSPI